MKISELIKILSEYKNNLGDLEIKTEETYDDWSDHDLDKSDIKLIEFDDMKYIRIP
jgi:hypothetical protein